MNRSSCNIANIMMTHKILNLEKSGKIRGNLYLHWKVKWTTTNHISPQEISINCLSSKKWRSISTCVLPSIKDPYFIFHTWNQGWEHFLGWFEIADWILPTLFFFCFTKSVDSLGENVVYFNKAYFYLKNEFPQAASKFFQ